MSTKTKKPSGAKVRQKKKRQKNESQQMKKALHDWLKPTDSDSETEDRSATENSTDEISDLSVKPPLLLVEWTGEMTSD